MDAGREPFPHLGPELTGDDSVGGDGVSGGVCHCGGVSDGVTLVIGVTLDDLLLSLAEPLFLDPPKLDMNERTSKMQGRVNNGL
jgi:hypothetical protein